MARPRFSKVAAEQLDGRGYTHNAPRTPSERFSAQIITTLTPPMRAELHDFAQLHGKSDAQVARAAIADFLARYGDGEPDAKPAAKPARRTIVRRR